MAIRLEGARRSISLIGEVTQEFLDERIFFFGSARGFYHVERNRDISNCLSNAAQSISRDSSTSLGITISNVSFRFFHDIAEIRSAGGAPKLTSENWRRVCRN